MSGKEDFGPPKRKEQNSPPVNRTKQKGIKHSHRERDSEQRSPRRDRHIYPTQFQRQSNYQHSPNITPMLERPPGLVDHNPSSSFPTNTFMNQHHNSHHHHHHHHLNHHSHIHGHHHHHHNHHHSHHMHHHPTRTATPVPIDAEFMPQAQEGPWGEKFRSFLDTTDETNKNIDFGTNSTSLPRWMTSNRPIGRPIIHSRHHTNIIENSMHMPSSVEQGFQIPLVTHPPTTIPSTSSFQQNFNFPSNNPFLDIVDAKAMEERLKPNISISDPMDIDQANQYYRDMISSGFDTQDWDNTNTTNPTTHFHHNSDLDTSRLLRPFRRPRVTTNTNTTINSINSVTSNATTATDQNNNANSNINNRDDLRTYFTRDNNLFDMNYPSLPPPPSSINSNSNSTANHSEHGDKRLSTVRERLRQLERRNIFDETREQAYQERRRRTRQNQNNRERDNAIRGEFGALMNALGLMPDDEVLIGRESANISRVRDAVFGIVNSRLPPHLLFSDRDFDADDYDYLCSLDDTIENRKGADDSLINQISLVSFDGDRNLINNEQKPSTTDPSDLRCPICLEEFRKGVDMRVMPCKHEFHKCCLDKWLKIKAVCPICSMNIKDKFGQD